MNPPVSTAPEDSPASRPATEPRALIPAPQRDGWSAKKRLALFGCILAGLALGYVLGARSGVRPDARRLAEAAPAPQETTTLVEEVRALRAQVEAARHAAEAVRTQERSRTPDATRDALAEASRATAALGARVERLEERLAKFERRAADPTPTGALAPPASKGEARTDPKTEIKPPQTAPKRLSGFLVHDVAHGVALIERGDGVIEEVAPGDSLPGAGRITSIERRGPGWVVVTTRGLIDQRAF